MLSKQNPNLRDGDETIFRSSEQTQPFHRSFYDANDAKPLRQHGDACLAIFAGNAWTCLVWAGSLCSSADLPTVLGRPATLGCAHLFVGSYERPSHELSASSSSGMAALLGHRCNFLFFSTRRKGFSDVAD